MHKALDELKTQAKILLKSVKFNDPKAIQRLAKHSASKTASEPLTLVYKEIAKLKHCQHAVSREAGFAHWQHAHSILSSGPNDVEKQLTDLKDMGTLWHGQVCHGLANHWFARYQDAVAMFASQPHLYLLPYKRQFVVVEQDYIEGLGLHKVKKECWTDTGRNLVASYGNNAWDEIAYTRLRYQSS